VPSDDRFGLNDGQRLPPANPEPGQQHPKEAISLPEARFLGSSLEDIELVAKCEILDGESALRLEDGNQDVEQGEKNGSKPIDVIG
jgi:hypothetical protein